MFLPTLNKKVVSRWNEYSALLKRFMSSVLLQYIEYIDHGNKIVRSKIDKIIS